MKKATPIYEKTPSKLTKLRSSISEAVNKKLDLIPYEYEKAMTIQLCISMLSMVLIFVLIYLIVNEMAR